MHVNRTFSDRLKLEVRLGLDLALSLLARTKDYQLRLRDAG